MSSTPNLPSSDISSHSSMPPSLLSSSSSSRASSPLVKPLLEEVFASNTLRSSNTDTTSGSEFITATQQSGSNTGESIYTSTQISQNDAQPNQNYAHSTNDIKPENLIKSIKDLEKARHTTHEEADLYSNKESSSCSDIKLLKSTQALRLSTQEVSDSQSNNSSSRATPISASANTLSFTRKPPVPKRRPDTPDIFDMFEAFYDPETKKYDRRKLREIVRFKSPPLPKPENNVSTQETHPALRNDTQTEPTLDKKPDPTVKSEPVITAEPGYSSDEEIPDDVMMASFKQDVALLHHTFRYARRIVVITGAGISVAAGIPDFRSTTGLFRLIRNDLKLRGNGAASGQQMFDASVVFSDDQALSNFHSTMCDLYDLCSKCEPTPFHNLINSVSKDNRLLRLYTQNIDCLDTKLPYLKTKHPLVQPWPKTVQLHGTISDTICTKCSWTQSFDPALFKSTRLSSDKENKEELNSEIEMGDNNNGDDDDVILVDEDEQNMDSGNAHLATFDQIKAHFDTPGKTSDNNKNNQEDNDSEINTVIESLHIPECPECAEMDDVRQVAGKRSQGIGKLRPKIVLYNEPNPDSEAIGQITEQDLLGKPDGLIVVGTTLKIPGVRRMVREMSQAVHAARGVSIWMNIDDPSVLSSREFESCFDLIIKGDCQNIGQILDDYEEEKQLFEEFQRHERAQRKKEQELRKKLREEKILEKLMREKEKKEREELEAKEPKKKKKGASDGKCKTGSSTSKTSGVKKAGKNGEKSGSKTAEALKSVAKKSASNSSKSQSAVTDKVSIKEEPAQHTKRNGALAKVKVEDTLPIQPELSSHSQPEARCPKLKRLKNSSKATSVTDSKIDSVVKKEPASKEPSISIFNSHISRSPTTNPDSKPALHTKPKAEKSLSIDKHSLKISSFSSGTKSSSHLSKPSNQQIKVANIEREAREELEEKQAKELRKQQCRSARRVRAQEREKRLLLDNDLIEVDGNVMVSNIRNVEEACDAQSVKRETSNGLVLTSSGTQEPEPLFATDSTISVSTSIVSVETAPSSISTITASKPDVMSITSIISCTQEDSSTNGYSKCEFFNPSQPQSLHQTDTEAMYKVPMKRKQPHSEEFEHSASSSNTSHSNTFQSMATEAHLYQYPNNNNNNDQSDGELSLTGNVNTHIVIYDQHNAWASPPCSQPAKAQSSFPSNSNPSN